MYQASATASGRARRKSLLQAGPAARWMQESREVLPQRQRGPAGGPPRRFEAGGIPEGGARRILWGTIPAAHSELLWAAAACAARPHLPQPAATLPPQGNVRPAPQRQGGNYNSHGRAGRAPPPSWAGRGAAMAAGRAVLVLWAVAAALCRPEPALAAGERRDGGAGARNRAGRAGGQLPQHPVAGPKALPVPRLPAPPLILLADGSNPLAFPSCVF